MTCATSPTPSGGKGKSLITQSAAAPWSERGNDLYETPPEAVKTLLGSFSPIPLHVWEPAAGRGAIVNPLREAGHSVLATDIEEYEPFKLSARFDFLNPDLPPYPDRYRTIITNPPYKHATEFVRLAIKRCDLVIMLMRLSFLEGIKRQDLINNSGLNHVIVFSRRLPMMHRDGWDGPRSTSAIPFAWFIWRRAWMGKPIVRSVDWKHYP